MDTIKLTIASILGASGTFSRSDIYIMLDYFEQILEELIHIVYHLLGWAHANGDPYIGQKLLQYITVSIKKNVDEITVHESEIRDIISRVSNLPMEDENHYSIRVIRNLFYMLFSERMLESVQEIYRSFKRIEMVLTEYRSDIPEKHHDAFRSLMKSGIEHTLEFHHLVYHLHA